MAPGPMFEGIHEYFVVICRECRMGHTRVDLPARPGVEGSTKCPSCGRSNPGWAVFGPYASPFFMSISPGGGRQGVRATIQNKIYTGRVVRQGMDGKVIVEWDDPLFQSQWGNEWFPLDKLERFVG